MQSLNKVLLPIGGTRKVRNTMQKQSRERLKTSSPGLRILRYTARTKASMTVHPVRMTGLVVGAPQTFRYFQRIQEQIADFVTANSNITKERFESYMMATGEMATDVGTILYGKEAVSSGLIDRLGGLNDALSTLHKMIDKQKNRK